MLSFCETKWVKFKFQTNWSFNVCIVAGALMYWQKCFGITFIEFRHATFLWVRRHCWQAWSQITALERKRNLHLNQWIIACVLCVCVCVSEIPVVSPTAVVSSTEEPAGQYAQPAPRPWAPPLYERKKKTSYLIFLGFSFKVWDKY